MVAEPARDPRQRTERQAEHGTEEELAGVIEMVVTVTDLGRVDDLGKESGQAGDAGGEPEAELSRARERYAPAGGFVTSTGSRSSAGAPMGMGVCSRPVTGRVATLPAINMGWLTPALFEPGDAEADVSHGFCLKGCPVAFTVGWCREKRLAQQVSAYQQSMQDTGFHH